MDIIIFSLRNRTKTIIICIVGFCLSTILMSSGCSGNTIPPSNNSCNTTNTFFQQQYNALLGNVANYTESNTMDLSTHEYSFKVGIGSYTICKVGYQGNSALQAANIPYTIEIADASNTILFSGSHVFASNTTDYFSITPVTLIAGQVYTIRRTINNSTVPLSNTIGRIIQKNSGTMNFPYTTGAGAFTITASNFYGRGGPVPNIGIPFIDIVFQ